MGSQDLLVMALALPPMAVAATLWWSARHAVDELRQSWAAGAPQVDGADPVMRWPVPARASEPAAPSSGLET